MGKKTAVIFLSILGITAIVMLALAVSLASVTMTRWSSPAAVCAVAAVPTGFLLASAFRMRFLPRFRILRFLMAFATAFCILLGTFYSLNFFLSDHSTQRTADTKVAALFGERHQHSRRVGRNRYVRGETYMEYYARILLPDSTTLKKKVPVDEYVRLRAGQRATLHMEDGLFGIPVIRNIDIPPRKTGRRHHFRRQPK